MRKAALERNTTETKIKMSLNIDGSGKHSIDTGIGFLDHMLELFAVHGNFDLELKCTGDLKVDGHHSAEDIGIVLGKLIAAAGENKTGINRYAEKTIPMDEALVAAYLDISGRPYLSYKLTVSGQTGGFDSALCEEFFRAVAFNGLFTLHMVELSGGNAHHVIEAAFKAFARALKHALTITGDKIPSSKGML